ncbi:MAG: futalosine hydrolase [Saprospiraceae bacterium]
MDLLLIAATPFEIAPTLNFLQQSFVTHDKGVFQRGKLTVRPLITGLGMVAAAWQLGLAFGRQRPGLALQAGVAGALDPQWKIGDVVHVVTERFGDLGVEEADGRLTDLFELDFLKADVSPFTDGRLVNAAASENRFLPTVNGLTVNKVHGAAISIAAIREKYPDAQVESMEGAAFFYACQLAEVPFLEIRSISNYVEPRNREAWDLPLAIENLNIVLRSLLESLGE